MSTSRLAALGLSLIFTVCQVEAQVEPTYSVRQETLKSVVRISASSCPDNERRVGTGFTYGLPSEIVTAHHVVGGCKAIEVFYEGVAPGLSKVRKAKIAKVLVKGDLALLSASDAPSVPVLRLATSINANQRFAGAGYQHGLPTAGDQIIGLSAGRTRLEDVLPDRGNSLVRSGSKIDRRREVIRFGSPLQPGMSGGPIIDVSGRVVAIVAGGLKAGASTASWGWPGSSVEDLLASNDATNEDVRVTNVYYSQEEMAVVATAERAGKHLRCGRLNFTFHGRKGFDEVSQGADDMQRVAYLLQAFALSQRDLDKMEFDIWVNSESGATAVAPAGYELTRNGSVCTAKSPTRPFVQVIWAAPAVGYAGIDTQSKYFELTVMAPRVRSGFQYYIDPHLTTFQTGTNAAGPHFRPNGMVFTRKGFINLIQPAPHLETVHSFETLVAHSDTFLGVGVINDDVNQLIEGCHRQPDMYSKSVCSDAKAHMQEWAHFVLATQLSTYPAI